MKISEFVSNVITQIEHGVSDAQDALQKSGSTAVINPNVSRKVGEHFQGGPLETCVDFELYVCPDGEHISTSTETKPNMLTFAVPMTLPRGEEFAVGQRVPEEADDLDEVAKRTARGGPE